MSTEIAQQNSSDLAIADGQTFWSDKQLSALRQIGVENASNGDLAVFFHQVTRTGLDPFARQIYMIGRKERGEYKQTIQTGIDGFRLIARRAADRRNEVLQYEDTMWCGEDGQWVDVWLRNTPPSAAKVTIVRGGGRFPAVALFTEYAATKYDGGLTKMWATKGALMLAKCAEALALRKAFPQDLSGLYTADEMQQSDNGSTKQERVAPQIAPTEHPVSRIPDNLASRIAGETEPAKLDQMVAWLGGLSGEDAQMVADLQALCAARVEELTATPAPDPEPVDVEHDAAQQVLTDVIDAEEVPA